MNNTPADTTATTDDQTSDDQPVATHVLSQWLSNHDPLSRAVFDRLRSTFMRTVGDSANHPMTGRTIHTREAAAQAFGRFAHEYDVALLELDEDARYGDLHGYSVADGTGWVPILVTTDDSGGVVEAVQQIDDSGGVVEAVQQIHDSYQAFGTDTTSTTNVGISVPLDHSTDRILMADGGTTPAETEPSNALNEDALVGLAEDEDELSWRYKTALAPDTFKRKRDDNCVEIDDGYYSKTLEVRDWPGIPRHGFFDKIVSFQMPNVDVTLSTHFTGEDKHRADRELADSADSLKQRVKSLARNKWIPDYFVDEAVKEYADVKRTQNTVSASEYSLYTSHTYIEVRALDIDTLDKAIKRIQSRMQDVSASAKELKLHPEEGYQTVAPACKNYLGGNTKMTGEGLARLIPWTARNLIEPGGIELGTNEDTGDPIILDLQNRETGFNVGIWGTIGSGKTTTLTRLLTRLKMRNPDMPMVVIDPKQEFSGLTWLFDGEKVTIGSDTGINPLQIEETPPEKLKDKGESGDQSSMRNAIRRAMDFVRSFYEYQGFTFENVQDTWRTAIKEAYRRRGITSDPKTHARDSPTLKDDVFPIFVEMVRMPENFVNEALTDVDLSTGNMQQRADDILHKHTGALQEGGEFEHLSMETSIDINNIDVLYLDLQNYENEVTAGLMMGPILTAVLEQAKEIDEPMALAMDEFHYMLQNSSSLETLKQAYRHSRHSDLSMITATQSVEEFFTKNDEGERQLTEDASTLTNLMSVKIWHFLEEMNDEWADEFDLTDAEQTHVENASTGTPTAQALLTLQKGGSYRLAVDYTDKLTPREFAMNQYDPSDHGTDPLAYLDGYTDGTGRDVTQWTWLGGNEITPDSTGDQTHDGTDIMDGTTVTADVADVDITPAEDSETSKDAGEGDHEPDAGSETSTITSATEVIEETKPEEEEGEGIVTRLKQSVTGGDGNTNSDADTDGEDAGLPLTDIGTVTARTASDLHAAGFETGEEVYLAENSALAEAEGFDESKAAFISDQAAKSLEESGVDTEALEVADQDQPSEDSASTSSPSPEIETETETESLDTPAEADPAGQDTTENTQDEGEHGEENASDDSGGLLDRILSSVSANHPAAGESDPGVKIISTVDGQKAANLREAGYETARDVYVADQSGLVEATEGDETAADYLREMAERTLEISDTSFPESTNDGTPATGDDAPDVAESGVEDASSAENGSDDSSSPVLTDIEEVGDDRADVLRAAGYESVEDVAAVEQDTLIGVEGIGSARAETLIESANDLLDERSKGALAEPEGGDE